MAKPLTPQELLVPRILWAAFLFTQLIFAGVGWSVGSVEGEPDPIIGWVLAGVGVFVAVIGPLLVKSLTVKTSSTSPAQAATTAFIMLLAFRESAGIMAFVTLFIVRDPVIWAIPAATSFVLILLMFPTSDSLSALSKR
ncbi:hypothetical protein G6O69_10850 [Pseudenhygromyxa sp. WMMC2535]|uniref:hypothetical protein n=1 Tax=Pseudenhygromyxa sp. WMMC2535 TaxID=2712867 RepID=UPI00155504C8|nr:hypothetical protein [Pseudenhygromyxa sp. WMMC2535]NVB38330.1 hypothetical protein [Pseudenhygromyxa sp. WMMC2535]